MNRIDSIFRKKQYNILSVFFTAGFPKLHSTVEVATTLEKAGADMLEIGMPYSDPLADGPVIQHSSTIALKNGMTLRILFEQLKDFRKHCQLPALLMGYANPLMQFGFEKFCRQANECGIDGIIIPDLPLDEVERFQPLFKKYDLHCVLLITPQTPLTRLKRIESLSSGFIYMVSSASTTGKNSGFSKQQKDYFKKIQRMKLSKPVLTGFGIHDSTTFDEACKYSNGAIVGSYFIRLLEQYEPNEAANQLSEKLKP
jgi:tryptophan synthase alpha chain